ncbi:unnamed protein product [Boreogadus saida]
MSVKKSHLMYCEPGMCPLVTYLSSVDLLEGFNGLANIKQGVRGVNNSSRAYILLTGEVKLPFPVDQITNLPRNDFQMMVKMHKLSSEQLEFIHDVRRRSKNRIAAQRCRKRKLDCILNLECEIRKLVCEKEKLLGERNQLKACMGELWENFSCLSQEVCKEVQLSPEQARSLQRYCPALKRNAAPDPQLPARHPKPRLEAPPPGLSPAPQTAVSPLAGLLPSPPGGGGREPMGNGAGGGTGRTGERGSREDGGGYGSQRRRREDGRALRRLGGRQEGGTAAAAAAAAAAATVTVDFCQQMTDKCTTDELPLADCCQ